MALSLLVRCVLDFCSEKEGQFDDEKDQNEAEQNEEDLDAEERDENEEEVNTEDINDEDDEDDRLSGDVSLKFNIIFCLFLSLEIYYSRVIFISYINE